MKSGSRRYAGLSADERDVRRRDDLVEATIAVLGTLGEPRTTVAAICAEADLAERDFHATFPGRDAALVAALDVVANEIATTATGVLATTRGSTGERCRAASATLADLVALQPARARVLVVESTSTPALRERRQALALWLSGVLADEAGAVFEDRAWPPEQARLHQLVFLNGFADLVAAALRGEVDLARDTLIDAGAELFAAVSQRPLAGAVSRSDWP